MTRLHYLVSTDLGLLQSTMTYMNRVHSMGYHWLGCLLQQMGLPLLHGVEAVLKPANVNRFEMLKHSKTEASKKRKSSGSLNTEVTTKKMKEVWSTSQVNFTPVGTSAQRYASVILPHTSEPPVNSAIAQLKSQKGLIPGPVLRI